MINHNQPQSPQLHPLTMKSHLLSHPAKLAAGLLAVLLAAAHASASEAIDTARTAMSDANYASMVSTLNPYLATNPNPAATDAQEARLLRAIGRAGVIVKDNLPVFLKQKGATTATFNPFAGTTVEFPMRPSTRVGKAWGTDASAHSLPLPPASGNSFVNDYLLAWQNTGAQTHTFALAVTQPSEAGSHGDFGVEIHLNGENIGHFSNTNIYDYGHYSYDPPNTPGIDFPIQGIRTDDGTPGKITGFTITLQPGQWLTFVAYASAYSPGGSGNLLTLKPTAALPAGIEVTTGAVPYDAEPAFANGTNLADTITFLGAQQTAIDAILADLDAIPSGFFTEFSPAETGIAGTLIVQYADVQMLAGLLKSSQAIHRFFKTYNLDVDLTNSDIIDHYLSTLTGDWRADDFIVDHPDLLRPTAASNATGNADCKAMRDLLTAAINQLLAVENTLFTRAAPGTGKSYLFGTGQGGGDSDGMSVGQSREDYHANLEELRDALTGDVALESDRMPTARGSLAPLFANRPLDLRDLFEFSERGILVGGSQNFLASGLLTGATEYQWENVLRDSYWWALGGNEFGYYSSDWRESDISINIENGAAAYLPYYPAGVFGSNAAALSYQWKLRHETANWWDDPSFTPITGATGQTLDLALLTDPADRGAYLSVGYGGGNELIGTAANVWVNRQDTADFNPDFNIIKSPLSQFFKPGQTVNLWVGTDAISKDMAYQWYKNNAPISGATFALYTIENATAGAAGDYHVVITGKGKTLTSDTARLRIPATATVTSVAVSPATATVFKGATQQFTATVTGSGAPAQSVTWSVTGAASAGTGISAGLLTVAAGETAAALTVRATSTIDTSKSATAAVTLVTPALNVDKTLLPLAQPAGSPGTFNVSGNVAWTAQVEAGAGWLAAPSPATGAATGTPATVTVSAASANTGAPRAATITVAGGGLVVPRTIHVTQAGTAAGSAPAALSNGATLTLDQPYTVVGGNLQPAGAAAISYEYAATGGDTAVLIFDDTVWELDFAARTFRADTDTGLLTGTLTYTPSVAATHTLTVASGNGGGAYSAGTLVTLIANPAPSGKVFDRWTTSAGGAFANATAATTTFTMPAAAVTVTANYKDQPTNPGNNGGGGGGGGGAPMLPGLALLAVLLALRARRK